MNANDAKQYGIEYLCKRIDLELCTKQPSGYYLFKNADEFIFKINHKKTSQVGGSEYLAVSKLTGVVRYLGFLGE